MRNRLPPIEQIEAFIHAARSPSFRVAAEQCALSAAAFSRRVQAFSHAVGLTLFVRTAAGARLTADGERCLTLFEPAYAELQRAHRTLAESSGAGRAVRLSLSHSLAVGWLLPRLDRLTTAYPEIKLQLVTDRTAGSFAAEAPTSASALLTSTWRDWRASRSFPSRSSRSPRPA